MKTTKYLRTAALALAGLVAAYGCAKKETDAPAPRAGQATPAGTGLAQAKDAWNAFVARVEGGAATDPLGQYVSKATQVANGDGTSARPTRAKYDAARPETLPKDKNGKVFSRPLPGDECPECGSGGGGYYPPAVTSTFVSSEATGLNIDARNPNNYMMDIMVTRGRSASVGAQQYYTKLPTDLNKGAGGKYLYLCFTRKVELAYTGYNLEGWSSGYRPITVIADHTQGGNNGYGFNKYYGYLVAGPPDSSGLCDDADFNDGAGGPYIWMYLSKSLVGPGIPNPVQYVREVGILSGNSSSITPPADWIKIPQDLNAGVGGDYIYLCYKY